MKPVRVSLFDFPDVVLHADELDVKRHSDYHAAKGGDIEAAGLLVADLFEPESVDRLREVIAGRKVELVPIHALESGGVNEIPAALASRRTPWDIQAPMATIDWRIRRFSKDLSPAAGITSW